MAKNLSPRAHKLITIYAQEEGKLGGSDQLLPEHVLIALLKKGDGLGYILLQKLHINVLTFQLALNRALRSKVEMLLWMNCLLPDVYEPCWTQPL